MNCYNFQKDDTMLELGEQIDTIKFKWRSGKNLLLKEPHFILYVHYSRLCIEKQIYNTLLIKLGLLKLCMSIQSHVF